MVSVAEDLTEVSEEVVEEVVLEEIKEKHGEDSKEGRKNLQELHNKSDFYSRGPQFPSVFLTYKGFCN